MGMEASFSNGCVSGSKLDVVVNQISEGITSLAGLLFAVFISPTFLLSSLSFPWFLLLALSVSSRFLSRIRYIPGSLMRRIAVIPYNEESSEDGPECALLSWTELQSVC